MEPLATYQPSGLIGKRAFLVAALVGVPLAVVLGVALAWAQSLAHGVIASSICGVVASLAVGLVFAVLAEKARSRNVLANTVGATALLAVLLTVRWWWAEALPGEALWSLVQSAAISLWLLPSVGAALEALLMGGIVLLLCRSQARAPFSESLGRWANKGMQGELWADSATASQVLTNLSEGGVAALLTLQPAARVGARAAAQWRTLEVQGEWVEDDPQSRWITVTVKTHERNQDGKVKSRNEEVVANWAVGDEEFRALQATLEGKTTSDNDTSGEAGTAPIPTVLQPALSALEAGQFKVCLSLAQAHCQHPDLAVQADAWRLCALAWAGQERGNQAFDAYHHLYALEPSTHNALQLATTSVVAGELTRGDAWFQKALEHNAENADLAPARLRTAYLSALDKAGEFEATLPHLDWLAQGYMAMGITDDHFVWARGFPFFSEFLFRSRPLLAQVLEAREVHAWYARMLDSLDHDGRRRLEEHMASA